MPLLIRGRKGYFAPKVTCPKRKIGEKPVARGLAMTPSDIERLAKQGIAVSTPAADQFHYDADAQGWNVDVNYLRDSDRNFVWETSQVSKQRILNARRRSKEMFGD